MIGVAGWIAYEIFNTPSVSGSIGEKASNLMSNLENTVSGNWKSQGDAGLYVPYIESVETSNGIPPDLLARIAYQESHFRQDIVDGAVKSPAGAVGLMQLMPQYFPGAGTNWQTDVNTAAKYLLQLYNEFGDWQLAVAAYNWGPGNVTNYVASNYTSPAMPTETSNYISAVFADVPVQGALIVV